MEAKKIRPARLSINFPGSGRGSKVASLATFCDLRMIPQIGQRHSNPAFILAESDRPAVVDSFLGIHFHGRHLAKEESKPGTGRRGTVLAEEAECKCETKNVVKLSIGLTSWVVPYGAMHRGWGDSIRPGTAGNGFRNTAVFLTPSRAIASFMPCLLWRRWNDGPQKPRMVSSLP